MRFWNRLFGRKKDEEVRSSSVFGDFLSYNGVTSYSENKALLLSTVYRCVEVISDSIAQLPLEPYLIDKNGFKNKFRQHPTYRLLNNEPNKNMSRFTFMKLLVTSMLLQGNAYAYIDRDKQGNAVGLYYIPSDLVTIISPKNNLESITYSVVGFKGIIEDCNMVHILNFTTDGITGYSTLKYARNTLTLASDAESNAQGFFRGGSNVGGILKSNSPLSDKQKERLKSSWNQAFDVNNGTPNGVAVLDADLSFQTVQISPEDAQLLETRQFNVIDICRFFGVSPIKVFDLSKSSYNTIEQQQLSFLTDTLQPLLEKFEEEFERKLYKPSEKANIDVRFDTSSLLRVDKQSLANYYNTLFQIGAITPNEIRKQLDLPEIENGNHSFVQVNIQTLDKATIIQPEDNNLPDDTKIENQSDKKDDKLVDTKIENQPYKTNTTLNNNKDGNRKKKR